jgi:hypothetical protein
VGALIKGALTAVAPIAFHPWSILVITPGTDVMAPAPGTSEQALFPLERMDMGVAGVGMKELVEMREH